MFKSIQKSFTLGFIFFEIILSLALLPKHVLAAQKLSGTYITGDITATTTWSLDGSPYIFTGQSTVPKGVSLFVDPGVLITATADAQLPALFVSGRLVMRGTSDKPITVEGIDKIHFSLAGGYITNTKFTGSGIVMYRSDLDISSSTVSNDSGAGIYVWESRLRARGVRFENNYSSGIFSLYDSWSGGGKYSDIEVHDSTFTGNKIAISNKYGVSTVRADGNWWGSVSGPVFSGPNSIEGENVVYDPWLTSQPDYSGAVSVCCSNILFIPGVEGSRLYSGNNQLWEPNRNADVEKLYLNEYGSSTDTKIFSGDPIDTALWVRDIYGKFMTFVGGMVNDGSINAWKPYGYDWRKPIRDVVLGEERKSTTTETLLSTLYGLASTSKTGKVTIVAHSNGGLVAKYLINYLKNIGREGIIDTLISVAVPYVGTPEAVPALLHGDGQSILNGFILSQSVARGLGKNLPSIYSLLPSKEYFTNILSPSVVLASNDITGINDGSYKRELGSETDQNDFIKDKYGIRMEPASTDISLPIIGNKSLLSAAVALHDLLDPVIWPESIRRYAIIGWNLVTTKAIEYSNKIECEFGFIEDTCKEVPNHRALTTTMGDGTVVVPSASYRAGTTTSINLGVLREREQRDINHSNILESSTTQSVIRNIIFRNNIAEDRVITVGEPSTDLSKQYLTVSTHSPVELHIYDALGRHTGPINKPLNLADNDFVTGAYEENIPGSNYRVVAGTNGGRDTYITLPGVTDSKFDVVINGTGLGYMTYVLEQSDEGGIYNKIVYETEPVTPLSVASTTITNGSYESLSIDSNGDGSIDIVANSNGTGFPGNATSTKGVATTSIKITTETLKSMVAALLPTGSHRNQIYQKIDHIYNLAMKGKIKQVNKQGSKILANIGHIELKTLTSEEKNKLISYIEQYIDSFGE